MTRRVADEGNLVPKLLPGVRLTDLAIGPREGFLLSRLDGFTSVADLGMITSMNTEEILGILDSLVQLGAVEVPGRTPPPKPTPRPARPRTWDPKLLDEPSELPLALREQVLDLAFSNADHYELLGVARDVDRKGIKSAYYAHASTLHPDRHFGKNLGSFKARMEQVFVRMTQAHDVLSNKNKRDEYDATLPKLAEAKPSVVTKPSRPKTVPPAPNKVPESIRPKRNSSHPRVKRASIPAPRLTSPAPPASTVAPPARPSISVAPNTPNGNGHGFPSSGNLRAQVDISRSVQPLSPEQEQARRDALARRLTHSSNPRIPIPRTEPISQREITPETIAQSAAAAAETLKRRYEQSRDNSDKGIAARYVAAAEVALERNDLAAAVNQYRLALQYTDDPAVQKACEAVTLRARVAQAESYLAIGRKAEAEHKWLDAIIGYGRAHEGRPNDADIQERLAEMLRRAGRDLPRAVRMAEGAVLKEPKRTQFRVTLAHVYRDAGLALRARGEAEQALRLAPTDPAIRALVEELRKPPTG